MRLGEILIERRLLTGDDLERALVAAFGTVTRWHVQPDGLRLPLP